MDLLDSSGLGASLMEQEHESRAMRSSTVQTTQMDFVNNKPSQGTGLLQAQNFRRNVGLVLQSLPIQPKLQIRSAKRNMCVPETRRSIVVVMEVIYHCTTIL